MKVKELEKIIKHIIEVYDDKVIIIPYDYEFIIEFTEVPELESFSIDRDLIKTYEDFLKFEEKEIKPALIKMYDELTKKQKTLVDKIQKLK